MPYDIEYDMLPAGYAAASTRAGEQAGVIMREFTSSEDADLFISRLEGLPSDIIAKLPEGSKVRASTVDTLLAIIRPDKTATVYVNEVDLIAKVHIKRSFEQGDPVWQDDVADIQRLEFKGIDVPDDAGIMFLMSFGWRKGLFFDLVPLHKDRPKRDYDLANVLGSYYAYVSHQHLFKIDDSDWEALFREAWFPFTTLSLGLRNKLINHVRSGWTTDDLLDEVHQEVTASLDNMVSRWERKSYVRSHSEVLETAVERFKSGDFISATSILYPRIEGVMRDRHIEVNPDSKASQPNLAKSVVDFSDAIRNPYSLLLPARFRDYLGEVYFASFEPGKPAPVSRNSVAHGVAGPDDLSLKAALVGLLTLDQSCYYMTNEGNKT